MNFRKQIEQATDKWIPLTGKGTSDVLSELGQNFLASRALHSLTRVTGGLSKHVGYIAPVRAYPSRYYFTQDVGESVDPLGANAITTLFEWKARARNKYNSVIGSLEKLELASAVATRTGLDEIMRLTIQPYEQTGRFNVADVGFGISQVLPESHVVSSSAQ